MYVMFDTRFDIVYVVFVVSRYSSNFIETHRIVVKRIFRYLNVIINFQLTFRGDLKFFSGYIDADWGGDRTTRRFISNYVFNIDNGAFSWFFKR